MISAPLQIRVDHLLVALVVFGIGAGRPFRRLVDHADDARLFDLGKARHRVVVAEVDHHRGWHGSLLFVAFTIYTTSGWRGNRPATREPRGTSIISRATWCLPRWAPSRRSQSNIGRIIATRWLPRLK